MLFRYSVANEHGETVSPYLLFEPRPLRDVCRAKRGDDDGQRCPSCCVRAFCEGQANGAGA
jgi:hypothetical protein